MRNIRKVQNVICLLLYKFSIIQAFELASESCNPTSRFRENFFEKKDASKHFSNFELQEKTFRVEGTKRNTQLAHRLTNMRALQ